MSGDRIDWEHPPSQRRQPAPVGKRLVYDCMVLAATGVILRVLLGALLDGDGVSERGMRHFMIDAVPGAAFLAWAVVAVVSAAALYALVDAGRALYGLRQAAQPGPGPAQKDEESQ